MKREADHDHDRWAHPILPTMIRVGVFRYAREKWPLTGTQNQSGLTGRTRVLSFVLGNLVAKISPPFTRVVNSSESLLLGIQGSLLLRTIRVSRLPFGGVENLPNVAVDGLSLILPHQDSLQNVYVESMGFSNGESKFGAPFGGVSLRITSGRTSRVPLVTVSPLFTYILLCSPTLYRARTKITRSLAIFETNFPGKESQLQGLPSAAGRQGRRCFPPPLRTR